jgi:hypothetical protein
MLEPLSKSHPSQPLSASRFGARTAMAYPSYAKPKLLCEHGNPAANPDREQ